MPRPSSRTVTELSGCSVTSTTLVAARERLVDGVVDRLVDEVVETRGPVEPMYMPGLRRTGSRPSRTVMSFAVYSVLGHAAEISPSVEKALQIGLL